jgi:hypothetical protein
LSPSDHDLLLRIDERTSELWRVVVKGNGQKSLTERVGTLEGWRSKLIGAYLLLTFAIALYAAVKR